MWLVDLQLQHRHPLSVVFEERLHHVDGEVAFTAEGCYELTHGLQFDQFGLFENPDGLVLIQLQLSKVYCMAEGVIARAEVRIEALALLTSVMLVLDHLDDDHHLIFGATRHPVVQLVFSMDQSFVIMNVS